jgi:hypothetical protein
MKQGPMGEQPRLALHDARKPMSGSPLASALMAGMPAEVFIITGERTVLDYPLRPFVLSVMRSFR